MVFRIRSLKLIFGLNSFLFNQTIKQIASFVYNNGGHIREKAVC